MLSSAQKYRRAAINVSIVSIPAQVEKILDGVFGYDFVIKESVKAAFFAKAAEHEANASRLIRELAATDAAIDAAPN